MTNLALDVQRHDVGDIVHLEVRLPREVVETRQRQFFTAQAQHLHLRLRHGPVPPLIVFGVITMHRKGQQRVVERCRGVMS